MYEVSFSDARNNFRQIIDDVCAEHEPIVITNKNRSSAVMLSKSFYDGMQETLYLMSSSANIRNLKTSIIQLKSENFFKTTKAPSNKNNSHLISWTGNAWAGYCYWKHKNSIIVDIINSILRELEQNHFAGHPIPLCNNLMGCWSRKINKMHRLVYTFKDDNLCIIQCQFLD